MLEAIRKERPDIVIHLGAHDRDCYRVRLDFPEVAVFAVQGNCDLGSAAPLEDIVSLGPVKAYITHGHMYNVKWGDYSSLAYAAMEQGAKIAMFGHTHEPYNCDIGSIKVLNPGTAGRGRLTTYAMVEVLDNGGIITEIKDL